MKQTLSSCGSDCAACAFYGNACKGCNACAGHVFHAPEGKACPLYACAVERHGYKSCAECPELPCALWRATRDSSLTDAEFEQSINVRVTNLSGIHFRAPLLAVADVERAKRFYTELLGQTVVLDFGANVTFSGGFAIQEGFAELLGLPVDSVVTQPHNMELYVEVDNFDAFQKRLAAFDGVEYVHETRTYPWLQRVVRIYDPDRHIIEIGESMAVIARRLLAEGKTPEAVSELTQHPLDFVLAAQDGKI